MRRLLVGDANRSPEYLLLDEVHTYAGTHGAQVANLLRRWRSEVATSPHIVGLSATLSDPAGFFSDLTGIGTSSISVVAPEPHEMTEIGREYFLALRGDPASQTSLLSTTIQTSMLLRRMLDQGPNQPSLGAFGSRVFVFTDDLDVTNRLHSQLEDAEGWRAGGVNRKPNGSLATLRGTSGPDVRAREDAGQLWGFAEQIGTLQRPVRVSRTTSRDAGVDADADVVVATASLEVGFDDPNVGAVLQHKAPRDAAQFLQRRGRAGRDPAMRPWTIVVLSDYGRDRLAFQSYEGLFTPVVQPTQLPLRNRVVLKMQATWWLLDYLGRFSSGTPVQSVIERLMGRQSTAAPSRYATPRGRTRHLDSQRNRPTVLATAKKHVTARRGPEGRPVGPPSRTDHSRPPSPRSPIRSRGIREAPQRLRVVSPTERVPALVAVLTAPDPRDTTHRSRPAGRRRGRACLTGNAPVRAGTGELPVCARRSPRAALGSTTGLTRCCARDRRLLRRIHRTRPAAGRSRDATRAAHTPPPRDSRWLRLGFLVWAMGLGGRIRPRWRAPSLGPARRIPMVGHRQRPPGPHPPAPVPTDSLATRGRV